MLMHAIVRIAVYAALYAPFLLGTIWYQKQSRPVPVWLKLAVYTTGLMLAVTVSQEMHW